MPPKQSRSEEQPSRIAAACNACRARKQKCGGEKPACRRCRQLEVKCVWPQQQKRGPAKGYTEALEARLAETEDTLFKVLSCIVVDEFPQIVQENSRNPFISPNTFQPISVPRTSDRKEAVERWVKTPLKTVENIKDWYSERSQSVSAEARGSTESHSVSTLVRSNIFHEMDSPAENEPRDAPSGMAGDANTLQWELIDGLENSQRNVISDAMHSAENLPRNFNEVDYAEPEAGERELPTLQGANPQQAEQQRNATFSTNNQTDQLWERTSSRTNVPEENILGISKQFQEDFLW